MKTNYLSPTVEIIEIEIEDAVLSGSGNLFESDDIHPGTGF